MARGTPFSHANEKLLNVQFKLFFEVEKLTARIFNVDGGNWILPSSATNM